MWSRRIQHLLALNIRGKIILPYLVLTMVVAAIGTYVVTSLVASSLDERLTNHLLEAGRVVSDTMARHELMHVRWAQKVASTRGFAQALAAGDRDSADALVRPLVFSEGMECFIAVDAEGHEVLHLLQRENGELENVEGLLDVSSMWIVQALLEENDVNSMPRRGIGIHPVNQRYYYFTALPVGLDGEVVGVAVVGTSLETLASNFKNTSLANVIIYLEGGRAVVTTFALADQPGETAALLDSFSISPELYERSVQSADSTLFESVRIRGRPYRLARAPLRVGDDLLGAFAVVLPSQFIVEAGATSRNTYALIFGAAMACVILVGYVISLRITRPLLRLVRTSQAVAEGDLGQRTGIGGTDEIGMLAATFDEMTQRLAERTRALQELLHAHKEAAGRMRAILSSIGDGVLLEDTEGNFVPMNAAAEAMLEEMADNFMLGPLQELSPEEGDLTGDLQASPWLLESRRFQVGKKVLSAHTAIVRTEDGERLGNVIVLRDVTAEVEAERLKDAFVAHVSHELRTPLTAIKGYTALLLGGASGSLDEEQRGFLETISRHADNLVAMINALLDFSEMEARGRLGIQPRPLSLADLVESVAEEWQPQMEEKDLAFRVEAPDDLPLVDADARRLRWAIINLVRNAWQYTPSGGEVTMRLSARDGWVILDVADTGVGIPPEHQAQLFDRFYRVANRSDDEVRGLGLGLYVTRAIVEAHGGKIRVTSEEGAGSTFSVILPALNAPGDDGEGNGTVGDG